MIDLFARYLFKGQGSSSTTGLLQKNANNRQPPDLACYTCFRTNEMPTEQQSTNCQDITDGHYCYASFVDFDGDGYLDLAAGKLWRNTDGEMFALVTMTNFDITAWLGWWHTWADFDGDGLMDVFSSYGMYKSNPLFVQGQNERFLNVSTVEITIDNLETPRGLNYDGALALWNTGAFFDYDLDGWLVRATALDPYTARGLPPIGCFTDPRVGARLVCGRTS